MRKRKTRNWLDGYTVTGHPDGNLRRMMRLVLQQILSEQWKRHHKTRIKRVHRGINARQQIASGHHPHHLRQHILFD